MDVEPQIIDTSYFSLGFPKENWTQLISRENYTSQIEDYFSKNTKLIFIDGEEDSGKTTLLAQFSLNNCKYSLSVFYNTLNTLDYTIEYFCANIISQIRFILGDKLEDIDSVKLQSLEDYQRYMFELTKFFHNKNHTIHLLIDGLEEIVSTNSAYIFKLLSILPIGSPIFRIIITGNIDDFKEIYPKISKNDLKSMSISGFTKSEIKSYLEISEEYGSEQTVMLYKITKGYPGRLKTLKRLIENENYSINDLSSTTTYQNWVQIDCDSIDIENKLNNVILSILSLTNSSFSYEDIAALTSLSNEDAENTINNIRVLENINGDIVFVSSAHKKYFSNILRGNKNIIQELLIKYYSKYSTDKSLIELPKLFYERKDWSKIIETINDEYLPNLINRTSSLKTITDILSFGVEASFKINKYSYICKFAFQSSIINELDNYLFWESEIRARIAIHDFAGAISLAETAILSIDRLRLLSLIARKQKEINNTIDEQLSSVIIQIYNDIDLINTGNKIYDIVTDLIYAMPNLAIEIIENSKRIIGDKNINDLIIAKLSIAAIDSNLKDKDGTYGIKKMEAIENLQDNSVININRAISFLVGNYNSIQVLDEVNKLSDSKERLLLLRLWLKNSSKQNEEIGVVIDCALNELIISSSKTPLTIEALVELSIQLPYIKDEIVKSNLLSRFNLFDKDLPNLGLTKNYYQYKLNLFHTNFTLGKPNLINELQSIIQEIELNPDLLIKLESYSELYTKLKIIKSLDFKIEYNHVYGLIMKLSKDLYSETASHNKLSENFLHSIGKYNPTMALLIATNINTTNRREKAILHILDSYLNNNIKHIKIENLKLIENNLFHQSSKEILYIKILERYSNSKNLHHLIIKDLIYYETKIAAIKDYIKRIEGFIFLFKIISKNEAWKRNLSSHYEALLSYSWQGIDSDWDKIDTGFHMCAELVKINLNYSKQIFKLTEELKESCWLDSLPVAYTYINCIKLVIISYQGLLLTKSDKESDFTIIESLINRIPSNKFRLNLWIQLAFNAHLSKRDDLTKIILDYHLIPTIQENIQKGKDISTNLDIFTLIYIFNSDIINELLKKVSTELHESIYFDIAIFYLTNHNPFDIYDNDITTFSTTYLDINNVLKLLDKINNDNNIYILIDIIVKAISKSNISSFQLIEIIDKLKKTIDNKLPDPNNIKHKGYLILAKSELYKLDKHSLRNKILWENLIQESRLIPNLSDSIFVQAILLENIPFDKIKGGNNLRVDIFNYIVSNIILLKSHFELLERVVEISRIMFLIDKNKWKIIIKKAFDLNNDLVDAKEIYLSQKRIIDSLYRIDPEYASEIIKIINNEDSFSKLLTDHLKSLELTDKIKNSQDIDIKNRENLKGVVNSIYMAQKSLNSNKIAPKKISDTSVYLLAGNKLPLHESFPVFHYYLSNCNKFYGYGKTSNPHSEIHRENFNEIVKSTNIVEILMNHKKYTSQILERSFIDEKFDTNISIKPHSREEALNFIKSWLSDVADTYIIISDPYFSIEDLEILKIILEVDRNLEIEILGSSGSNSLTIETDFRDYWKSISDEEPAYTNITFVWITGNSNNSPFHDRWILTKNGGLRLGTSIKSLGINKDSEISIMRPNEALRIKEDIIFDYIHKKKREHNSQRVMYKSFTL